MRVLGLTGPMLAGKSTVYNYITWTRPNVQLLKFAQPLYDIQHYAYSRISKVEPVKDRRLLQFLGTEWGREISPSLWVDLWSHEVRGILRDQPDALIIADDVRFQNEVDAVKRFGGYVLEISAEEKDRADRGALINTKHASENGVIPMGRINNTGTKAELYTAIDQFLKDWEQELAGH